MPFTQKTLQDRSEAYGQAQISQLKSKGFSDQDIADMQVELTHLWSSQLAFDVINELKLEYGIPYSKAKFIFKNITDELSSNDVLSLVADFDDTTLVATSQLKTYFSLTLEEAAKEAHLINDKDQILNSSKAKYLIYTLIKNSKDTSISEIANTISKHTTVTDEQLSEIACWRADDITNGSISLEQVLENTEKYGIHGFLGTKTGLQPTSSWLYDCMKAFFGYKDTDASSADTTNTELVDDTLTSDAQSISE